jgi:cysteinyl-tRNA synthetase
LRVEGRKMSKSLGNFLTVRDALQLADKNVWRLVFLRTHPRSPLDYSSERLKEAQSSWARLENALLALDASTRNGLTQSEAARTFQDKFDTALSGDMNTPEALAAVFDAVTEYNRSSDESLAQAARAALEMLGFTFDERSVGDALTPQLLDMLVTLRNDARERRDWKGADQIRNQLKELGVVLEDTPEGTRWKIERYASNQ